MTYHHLAKAIKYLRNDCSTGYGNLPAKRLKLTVSEIPSPLTYVINACIDKNIFPQNWKIYRLSPVPKENDPKGISDYKPISILLIQSGYRESYFTVTTLLKLKDDTIMVDYLKAFDTVDYSTLLNKMQKLRFGKNSPKLVMDYLTDISLY